MTSTASSFRIRGLLRLGAIALGLLILQPALARKDDRQKPMNVEHADSFEGFNAPNSITTLHGHVVLSQGTLKITGDQAKIHFDADQNVSRIEITGTPAHIQQLDDSGNLMTGDSAKLDYDNNHGIAVLSGNAVVKQQGRGEAHGDKLTYNTETAQMSGSSGSDGMVHMTFLPKPRSATAPTSATDSKPAAASTATPPATPAPAASSATTQGHR